MKQEVLVIDDNFDIRNLISEILKDKNYNVRVAANFDQAVSEIHKKLPDIIFASSPQLPSALVGLIISKLINKPFILEVRDLWPQVLIEQGGKSPSSLLIKLLTIIEKILYKNASYVIVLAKGAKKFVKRKGARNVNWLPNGPDLNIFQDKNIPKEPKKFITIEHRRH